MKAKQMSGRSIPGAQTTGRKTQTREAMVARGNLNPNKGGDTCHF